MKFLGFSFIIIFLCVTKVKFLNQQNTHNKNINNPLYQKNISYKQENILYWKSMYSDIRLIKTKGHLEYYGINNQKLVIIYSNSEKKVISKIMSASI